MVSAAMKLKDAFSLEDDKPRQCIKKKKRRDITSLTKVCLVKAMVFPVVMCGSESHVWTIKKAEP